MCPLCAMAIPASRAVLPLWKWPTMRRPQRRLPEPLGRRLATATLTSTRAGARLHAPAVEATAVVAAAVMAAAEVAAAAVVVVVIAGVVAEAAVVTAEAEAAETGTKKQ